MAEYGNYDEFETKPDSVPSEENDSSDEEISGNDLEEASNLRKGMTMEEQLAIQEEIGTKAFAKRITKEKCPEEASTFRRLNKNRPREFLLQRFASPKMPIDKQNPRKPTLSKQTIRDPRFDDLSGKLDTAAWKKNYKFISEQKKDELKMLKDRLSKLRNKEKKEVQKVVQRMENQERELKKLDEERLMKKEKRELAISSLKEGKKPKYESKSKQSLAKKVARFIRLKKDNKLEKHLEKKEKESTKRLPR